MCRAPALSAAKVEHATAGWQPEEFGPRAVVGILRPVEPGRLAARVRRPTLGPLPRVGVPGDRRVCHGLLRSLVQPPDCYTGRLECLTQGAGCQPLLGLSWKPA